MPNVITDITVHPSSTTALAGNQPYRGLEWHPTSKPDYHLYIFNCSGRNFCDPMDPLKPLIGTTVKIIAPGILDDDPTEVTVEVIEGGKKVLKVIPGEANKKYHYVTSFPQPFNFPKFNDESGEIEFKPTDVRRVVVDMISPDNPTLSLDFSVDPSKAFSIGNDYAQKGVFFSYTNPPMQIDLQKAYNRMEKYYRMLNEKAATLEMTDKLGLQAAIQSNPDHVYAANYYGKAFPWASKAVRPVECPNCGEQKPAGRKFHQTSFGTFCVEPTQEAWKAVVMSGNRKKEDVPDELRWWKEKTA